MATPAVADSDQGSDLLSEADTDSDQAGQTRNLPGQLTQIGPDTTEGQPTRIGPARLER